MNPPFHYRCFHCGKTFARDEVRYLCPECGKEYRPGEPLRGVLEAIFDYEYIAQKFDKQNPDWSLFSPVEPHFYPSYPVGNTPFFKAARLCNEIGFANLFIKNDGLNPSGSLKDRASHLVAAEANRVGADRIVAASTGNAASALAAVCAAANKTAIVFAPANAPKAKLVQIVLYGAQLILVDGTYDDAFRLSLEYTERNGGLNRNTAYHPLTVEGKKTVVFEIFAQNGFRAPDAIIVPVGDGVIISGVYKGFWDLMQVGLIEKLPQLVCVQAAGSAAIHNFIMTGEYSNVAARTIADSISVSAPANAHMAKRAVIESGGFSIAVSDDEIMDGQALLARMTGIFAEPAAAATMAALMKIRDHNKIDERAQIVLLITGNGLKDIDAPLRYAHLPQPIAPNISAIC